jgi:hypothetical protein
MSRAVMMAILSVATVDLVVSCTLTGSAQNSSGREDEEAVKKVIVEITPRRPPPLLRAGRACRWECYGVIV